MISEEEFQHLKLLELTDPKEFRIEIKGREVEYLQMDLAKRLQKDLEEVKIII